MKCILPVVLLYCLALFATVTLFLRHKNVTDACRNLKRVFGCRQKHAASRGFLATTRLLF